MNYQKGVELKQQYPNNPWREIQDSIFKLLSELLKAAISSPPPAGLAPSPQCRALYAADLMLKWNRDSGSCHGMEPQLLEVNFCPDCVRACRYHPEFFNDVFQALFLEPSQWTPNMPITRLL
jgi:tubulin--tyrosine ligase-like protein 12